MKGTGEVLGTRASKEQYELIRSLVPAAVYDPISRIVKVEKPDKEHVGCVAVCTGEYKQISRWQRRQPRQRSILAQR